MALLQIAEPDQKTTTHHAVGIDLGTTHSLVAYVDAQGEAKAIAVDGSALMPSVVHCGKDATTVGRDALAMLGTDPMNTIWSAKRCLGRSCNEITNPHPALVDIAGRPYYRTDQGDIAPMAISSHILQKLRHVAEDALHTPVYQAVITVPAYFDDNQRQLTRNAAQLAGWEVLRLINEPTAAAMAYGLQHIEEGITVVYDLGGGTFDVTVLARKAGVFQVLATNGDTYLGGDDIDRAIAAHLMTASKQTLAIDAIIPLAKAAKEHFGSNPDANDYHIASLGMSINRTELDSIVQPVVAQTLTFVTQALHDAGQTTASIDSVVMVGGSTKLACIVAAVEAYFGKASKCSVHPEHVVALGAAIQAHTLIQGRSEDTPVLLDVNPLSLGIETLGGLFEKIIPRNTAIPISRAQEFTTSEDNQVNLKISVYQGERELVQHCRKLADFVVRNIPPMKAGLPRIKVVFAIDSNGILHVAAQEKVTNAHTAIEVNNHNTLDEHSIRAMLKQSIDHAEADMQQRALAEAKMRAESICKLTNEALASDGDLLTQAERESIEAALTRLTTAIKDAALHPRLDDYTNALIKATDSFAARRMDARVRRALQGQSIQGEAT